MKLITASLATLLLAACSSTPQKATEAKPTEPTKPTISAEAQKALEQAEADAKEAKSKFALWVTSESALKAAEEAAKTGDSAAVLTNATYASSQAKAGLAQLNYPSTEQK